MIDVYTANTPNGVKVPIALEELGLAYRIIKVNLAAGEQKQPEYLRLNPNGRIPVIVDPQGPKGAPVSLFESGAILLYLAEKAPGLLPVDPDERLRALEYVFLQVGGVGPMFGQAGWFMRSAPEPMPIAIERYRTEALRLTGVLESRLGQHEWLAGRTYSIADIMHFGWLRVADYAGVDVAHFPAVKAWVERIAARSAVARALAAVA
jgi:glutathione S-transferase